MPVAGQLLLPLQVAYPLGARDLWPWIMPFVPWRPSSTLQIQGLGLRISKAMWGRSQAPSLCALGYRAQRSSFQRSLDLLHSRPEFA